MIAKIILMIILSIIGLLLIMVGVGFFISSLYLYLESVLHNSTMAALFCGLAFLILAILLFFSVMLIKSALFKFKQPKKIKEKIAEIQADPTSEALHLVEEYPFRSTLIAAVSGFVLGMFPKLRDHLIDGVSTYMQTGSVADSLKSFKSNENDE